MLGILPSTSLILELQSVFKTSQLVSLEVFFSSSLIFFSKSDLSVSHLAFRTNPVVSILFTFVTNLFYTFFLTTSLFTTLLSLLKSTGTAFNLFTSILSTSVF